ncbi:HEPN/Toprim-associated domain-containing protein [Shewanella algae]|uniref:HEPN/Toprim-associated domain-containing protein n=1 Tax=Shewanella algae TaxID=38313 RepID=UPI003004C0CD
MGSWADIKIKDHVLLEWKNTFDEWYFTKQDRVREISDNEDIRDFIGYKIDAKTLKRRLQLAGHDLRSAKLDFEEVRSSWISEMKESLLSYRSSQDSFSLDLADSIEEELQVLENYNFDDWIKMIPKALNHEEQSNWGFYGSKVHIDGEPLLSFMLSSIHGVFDEHQGWAGSTFPCQYVESYAVVLLDSCANDDECVLEITEIVNGGWVSDFDDIAQVQAGETRFHDHFSASLDELSVLNESTDNATLQRMVFASVITTMEAYLSDTMKSHVLNRSAIKRRFVESHSAFKEKIFKKDVFAFIDNLDKTLNDEIDKISFHNIDTFKELYKKVLACEFSEDKLAALRPLVLTRHDIVHRNGRKIDGYSVDISQQDVTRLVEQVRDIIKDIDKQIIDGLLFDV